MCSLYVSRSSAGCESRTKIRWVAVLKTATPSRLHINSPGGFIQRLRCLFLGLGPSVGPAPPQRLPIHEVWLLRGVMTAELLLKDAGQRLLNPPVLWDSSSAVIMDSDIYHHLTYDTHTHRGNQGVCPAPEALSEALPRRKRRDEQEERSCRSWSSGDTRWGLWEDENRLLLSHPETQTARGAEARKWISIERLQQDEIHLILLLLELRHVSLCVLCSHVLLVLIYIMSLKLSLLAAESQRPQTEALNGWIYKSSFMKLKLQFNETVPVWTVFLILIHFTGSKVCFLPLCWLQWC